MTVRDTSRVYDLGGVGKVYSGLPLHILALIADEISDELGGVTVRPERLAARLNTPQRKIHEALRKLERDRVLVRTTDRWNRPCWRVDFDRLAELAARST